MITYTVHEPPGAPADRLDRAESLVFVRDGYSLTAAIFTPFWAIANRLWLVLVGYVLVVAALELGLRWMGVSNTGAATVLITALHLLVGLEASSLHRWTLRRRGWSDLGSVSGRNSEDCERRFFDLWLPTVPMIRPAALAGAGLGAEPRPLPVSERPRAEPRGWLGGGWRSAR